MITTVIFDMDGVIIDSEPIHFKLIQKLFRERGLDLTEEEHTRYVGRSDFWSIMKEKFDLDIGAEELHQIYLQRFMSYLKHSFDEDPIDGVIGCIRDLDSMGKKLVLASSATRENIRVVMDMYSLWDYFDQWISGAELETSKPHPEIFLKAAELIGSDPDECLVIEDSENGVKAAKAAGMICIGYRNLNSGKQDLGDADYVIDDFSTFDLAKYEN